ncbi:RND superfamily drug efflux protein [Niallia circulans]|uniref:efflux RND transporter permease subunit n=1 Tax=Shouchella clausii TaxID=79880 RepID=UPI000B965E70|nr:MMPL family transporter [Shouchella clausii]SPU18265.1 RND superfamily drug efflux protein [Niallia circulans]AST95687.1 RND transporter [Shouchella clausii]MBX0319033.1 MMPL family transporter [Shouchella clausii]MEB5472089.1 MMPL family transporter [Shouchella clausii]PAF15388.1 RND transporter [Shouchella clausii]
MFVDTIIKHKKGIILLFAITALFAAVAQFFVSTNYNMVDYLPDDAPSTEGLALMEEEFRSAMPNANVLIHDVSIQEAIRYKEQLASIDGVSDVSWLDDVFDIRIPLEMADSGLIETYYKDHDALFSVTIDSGAEVAATDDIYSLIGEENAVTGEAVNTATSQKMTGSETLYAAALLVPIIIIILVLSTKSWVEPLFFLTAIGVSVLINLGTNIFLGEVSFVTQAVAPILQLAVSLDYAIFLLHTFSDELDQQPSPKEAMAKAMRKSFPVIFVSALTTFFGFMSLMLMDFGIGVDLGFNLVKGIVFSFISVVVFLPALTLTCYKWIEKTTHRSFVPSFKGSGAKLLKLRIPALVLVLLLLVPSFLAQSSTTFLYGLGDLPEQTRAGADAKRVEETFGQSTPIVLLVPNDDIAKEEKLVQELEQIPYVESVLAYANMVGAAIPSDFLDDELTSDFHSENYSRITVYTSAGVEGDIPFALVEQIREIAQNYYGDAFYTLGESATLYDMKQTISKDNQLVNVVTIITIAVVLMFMFRSISIPIILLLTIQAAVWLNLSVPYFTNEPLVFVGYLIVSTVQLAATIDYAILLMETYKHHRQTMPSFAAMKRALDEKLFPIAVSAAILSSVGFILWFTSSNPTVSSIGLLLGRGAALAFLLVILFLPAFLLIADRLIEKTTHRANFYKEEDSL